MVIVYGIFFGNILWNIFNFFVILSLSISNEKFILKIIQMCNKKKMNLLGECALNPRKILPKLLSSYHFSCNGF